LELTRGGGSAMTLTVAKTAAEPPAQSATSSSVAEFDGRASCFPSKATAPGPQMVTAVAFVVDYFSVTVSPASATGG